jgi:hypothetical protein
MTTLITLLAIFGTCFIFSLAIFVFDDSIEVEEDI